MLDYGCGLGVEGLHASGEDSLGVIGALDERGAIYITDAGDLWRFRVDVVVVARGTDAAARDAVEKLLVVNDEVVHGIPSAKRILNEGDILSIDCGVIIDGYYSDAAVTYPIGKVTPETTKLLEVTKASLEKAIQQCQVGGRLGDISSAVQEHCEAEGFGVVREFVGHGIGRAMHEDPQVPNFGAAGKGPRLKAGMVLAIEPMINAGGPEVKVLKDGWTAVTIDGSYSAHFEHTVAITKDGPQVLTR